MQVPEFLTKNNFKILFEKSLTTPNILRAGSSANYNTATLSLKF